MRRKTTIAVAAAAICAAAAPVASEASGGPWYWTRHSAEFTLLNHWQTSDGEDYTDVHCYGAGKRWRGLWHTFTCEGQDTLYREFRVRLTALSRYRAKVVEVKCWDDSSEYYCP